MAKQVTARQRQTKGPLGNVNSFIDRMFAKQQASGELVAPAAGPGASGLTIAKGRATPAQRDVYDRAVKIGLPKDTAEKAAQRVAPVRIDVAKLLAKRGGGLPVPGGNYGMPQLGKPPTLPTPGGNYGMPTPTPSMSPGGPAAPFGRGIGQGITAKGFAYDFPEEPAEKGKAPTARGPKPADAQEAIDDWQKKEWEAYQKRMKGKAGTGQPKKGGPATPPPSGGGGTEAPPSVKPAGGLTIGVEMRPPHTLRRGGDAHGKGGKPCRTDRWFDRCGLVYDASQPDDGPMGFNNPRLFLAGTGFRCWYPNSTRADFAAIMSSGSSGRWLQKWGQRSAYVKF